MAIATSTDFQAKWEVNLLNEAGTSFRARNFEEKGEKLAEDGGLGISRFLSHNEALKQAKETEKITVVCKVGFKYTEVINTERSTSKVSNISSFS
jgi:hypothetical protein